MQNFEKLVEFDAISWRRFIVANFIKGSRQYFILDFLPPFPPIYALDPLRYFKAAVRSVVTVCNKLDACAGAGGREPAEHRR